MEKQQNRFLHWDQRNHRPAIFWFCRVLHYLLGFVALYFSYRIATTPKNDSRTVLALVCITCIVLFACTQTDSLVKRLLILSRPEETAQNDAIS